MNEVLEVDKNMLLSTRLVFLYFYFVAFNGVKNEQILASHNNNPKGYISSTNTSGN